MSACNEKTTFNQYSSGNTAAAATVTGHNSPGQNLPFSGKAGYKPTESHITDLKAKFQDWRT